MEQTDGINVCRIDGSTSETKRDILIKPRALRPCQLSLERCDALLDRQHVEQIALAKLVAKPRELQGVFSFRQRARQEDFAPFQYLAAIELCLNFNPVIGDDEDITKYCNVACPVSS